MRALVIGCGYVGQVLAQRLVELGHEVDALKRDPSQIPAANRLRLIKFDISDREQFRKIDSEYDWIINTVSSSRGGVEEYISAYLRGTENILDWCASNPPSKYVYTSSTSVYGQRDGSVVDETSPTEPESPTSQVLVQVEQLLLQKFHAEQFPAIILRAAGIYGPDRGHLFQQFLKNEARISGSGAQFINMVHREDVVAAIIQSLLHSTPGEVYNLVDDEPVTQVQFFEWLSQSLGKPLPPTASSAAATRKRGVTNKRISNRKLKEALGYTFKYPTFREGYTAEIASLEKAGLLQVDRNTG